MRHQPFPIRRGPERPPTKEEAAMTWRLGTVVLTLAIACLVAPNADAGDGKSFSLRDVDGPTAFDFDGFVTVGGTLVPAASIGRFVADGRGNLNDGERTLVVGG